MSLQDQISHAAAVTKWKADQQVRIFKIQNQIREIENQIRTQKAFLADAALSLHSQGKLVEEELSQICQTITALHSQIAEQQQLQEIAKSEQAPQLQSYTASYRPPPPSFSGLVCPKCSKPLAGRFCPIHGVEGITPYNNPPETVNTTETVNTSETVNTTETFQQEDSTSAQLVCPICKRPLNVRFCPEHGVEGISIK